MSNEKKDLENENLSFSLNMASPISKIQMFVLPNPDNMIRTRKGIKGNKYKNVKSVELVLIMVTLFSLFSELSLTEDVYQDLMISVFMGFSTAYPLLFLLLKVNVNNLKSQVLGINAVMSIFMIFTAILIMNSWWQITDYFKESGIIDTELTSEAQYYLSAKLFSGITVILNAFVYSCETIFLLLEVAGLI